MRSKLYFAILIVLASLVAASAQTSQFTYQGRLTDGSVPAGGTYQMQFSIWDAVSGGTQIGSTLTFDGGAAGNPPPVTVVNGVFTVNLNFSPATPFAAGADRWIQTAVRKTADPPGYTTLNPRQQLTSSPYAIRTLNSAQADLALDSQKLGGTVANQFVQTTDPRLGDSRNPLPNSTNYIQNTATPQAGATFNIGGNASQNLSAYGLAKAMALVSYNKINPSTMVVTVVRCYNGVLNTSIGNCGFTTGTANNNVFATLDFGFTINDRFIALTSVSDSAGNASTVNAIGSTNSTTAKVGVTANTTGSFYIIVY